MSGFKVVIPARYASSRLPGKPLADIGGRPMIWHSWQRGIEAAGHAADVFVATDDARIFDAASAFGATAVMTAPTHENGTERLAEVVQLQGWAPDTIVVNVQGDEPLLPPELVQQVAADLHQQPAADIATLGHEIRDPAALTNANIVKIIRDKMGFAQYFSRACVPHDRDGAGAEDSLKRYPYLRHIGLYAYRASTLAALTRLEPAPAEKLEALEQLRALWHGMRIYVGLAAKAPPHGVDTEADLDLVRAIIDGTG